MFRNILSILSKSENNRARRNDNNDNNIVVVRVRIGPGAGGHFMALGLYYNHLRKHHKPETAEFFLSQI